MALSDQEQTDPSGHSDETDPSGHSDETDPSGHIDETDPDMMMLLISNAFGSEITNAAAASSRMPNAHAARSSLYVSSHNLQEAGEQPP